MSRLNVTGKMADYIHENQIEVSQVARDTNISENKLRGKTKEGLDATEFLNLCNYLNVKPEEFMG